MAYLAVAILILGLTLLFLRRSCDSQMLPQWLNLSRWRQLEIREESETADSIDESDHESTPKALASNDRVDVPAFSLSEHSDEVVLPSRTTDPAPSPRNADSLKHAQTLASPMRAPPPSSSRNASTLMPPPARPTPKPASSAASSLRVPSTGPLPNRGPPANSQQRVNGGSSPNGATATSNSRGKVLLAPGHSPMDWAALTRKGNLSGVDTFQRVTPSVLKTKTGRKGKPAWSSWHGKVYNITPYLPFHPGGEAELMKAAGRDGQRLFEEIHPWVNWENMLGTCLVGVMVPEDYVKQPGVGSSLEDID